MFKIFENITLKIFTSVYILFGILLLQVCINENKTCLIRLKNSPACLVTCKKGLKYVLHNQLFNQKPVYIYMMLNLYLIVLKLHLYNDNSVDKNYIKYLLQ